MNLSKNSYNHIKSFEDFENEKIKLYFQIRLSEKKLQLRYIELTSFLNPMKFIPLLLSSWVSPLIESVKNIVIGFFAKDKMGTNSDQRPEKSE